jgi:hypothetical protein
MPGLTPTGFAQDILTRIVNVHWGGGAIFVIGDDSGQIWRCEMKTLGSKPNFTKMAQQIGANNLPGTLIAPGKFTCGSFAKVETDKTPTFLFAGIDNQFASYDSDGEGHFLFSTRLSCFRMTALPGKRYIILTPPRQA